MHYYWSEFVTLLVTPFKHISLIWGIVPLYFGLLLNETTSDKANFRTAIQTGFSFLWAVAQWTYPLFASTPAPRPALSAINALVTILVFVFGLVALLSGVRKRFPKYGRFLGHTRFANYFMIMIFPMQALGSTTHYLDWTWGRLAAIIIFAVPVWLALHFGLMPIRGNK